MNLFELVLVPLAILEVVLLTSANLPLPLLRALRPMFRISRLVRVLVKSAGQGQKYIRHLRRRVSGDRIRFTQDGFDLDLAYITTQIIAMSVPAVGYEALICNPYQEVAQFLNERHFKQYLLVNTTEEQRYPNDVFFERCLRFPIPKDGVPTLGGLMRLSQVLDLFLRADKDNLIAVHSKYGQGRVSLVILGLLLYRGAS